MVSRGTGLFLLAIALIAPLTGCGRRSLDEAAVLEFIDTADVAARKRFAPDICELRAESFELTQRINYVDDYLPPAESLLGKKLYCREAGKFSTLRQYSLVRDSIEISVAGDGQTATVTATYTEKMPFYEEGIPAGAGLDMYTQMQVGESDTVSEVGIEDGELRFLSTEVDTTIELVPKSEEPLPYS
jgi:hypothetical protein